MKEKTKKAKGSNMKHSITVKISGSFRITRDMVSIAMKHAGYDMMKVEKISLVRTLKCRKDCAHQNMYGREFNCPKCIRGVGIKDNYKKGTK